MVVLAVPVMVKVVEVSTLLGPVIDVVGVWSSKLNVSIFLMALVESRSGGREGLRPHLEVLAALDGHRQRPGPVRGPRPRVAR